MELNINIIISFILFVKYEKKNCNNHVNLYDSEILTKIEKVTKEELLAKVEKGQPK